MKGSLRSILALLLAAASLGSCVPTDDRLEEHVLNRIGYGPDPWSLARIRVLGARGYVEEQLQPETLDDGALEADLLSRYPLLGWDLYTIRQTYHEYQSDPDRAQGRPRVELTWAKALRAVRSQRQLEQVLVDFWFNHFNVDARVDVGPWAVATYERDAIRPFVLGRFRDLLRATAGHAAMLEYLDNSENFVPGFIRDGRFLGPNENFGREILELHTVGVDAGYTLADIQGAALAFSGWTTPIVLTEGHPGSLFVAAGHDPGPKQVMGLSIPAGGGTSDAEAVIDYLASHPETALHLSGKLCRRFVSETPPAALVQRAAQTFLDSDGDLREVMRTILLSNEFLTAVDFRGKTKRPLHFVASLARIVGVADDQTFAERALMELAQMGEELYTAAPPTGYPDRSAAWGGEGPFLFRANLAFLAVHGFAGFGPPVAAAAGTPELLVDDLVRRLLHGGPDGATRKHIVRLVEDLPDWARAQQAAAVLLASPEFLTH